MKKSTLLSTAAITGLVAAAAFSGQAASAADSTMTVAVAAGSLSISAPTAGDLGSVAPGSTGTATLAGVEVTDARAGTVGWPATVAISDFTSATLSETIPATNLSYAPGVAATTGTATVTAAPATGGTASAVQTATDVSGNNTATWDGTLDLTVPADALAAPDYTATVTHSVA
ncbi:WxL domain-containing protein [Frigoribacterium faeni]|uniref:WxL domain-containing protein n=1 Tax=Frigoribacterium faeni TaxID=145483 RepID=A0A7W3PJX7_9MICO|nr:WxL domain-containing protein [Frigoribacterium faeni]MBA8814272.1 hypothetical protein [Frigoribacterium faeni]BFF12696.1 hypothetical protein GCM10025699_39990 [Microbacterium flavescens]BFF16342.1 hypothetical protein GCM10025699_76450 [Microbacterium flavescens]GEK83635.1 hypothetical protein FFA01_19440 [Frigoribacterium faeni]